MATLQNAKQYRTSRELLVATDEGRALYLQLGWETASLYWTASIATA